MIKNDQKWSKMIKNELKKWFKKSTKRPNMLNMLKMNKNKAKKWVYYA